MRFLFCMGHGITLLLCSTSSDYLWKSWNTSEYWYYRLSDVGRHETLIIVSLTNRSTCLENVLSFSFCVSKVNSYSEKAFQLRSVLVWLSLPRPALFVMGAIGFISMDFKPQRRLLHYIWMRCRWPENLVGSVIETVIRNVIPRKAGHFTRDTPQDSFT